MSLSPIGASAPSQVPAEVAKPVAPAAPVVAPAALKPDTVSISTAGKAAAVSDPDGDGH
jgi:hypothetical protein